MCLADRVASKGGSRELPWCHATQLLAWEKMWVVHSKADHKHCHNATKGLPLRLGAYRRADRAWVKVLIRRQLRMEITIKRMWEYQNRTGFSPSNWWAGYKTAGWKMTSWNPSSIRHAPKACIRIFYGGWLDWVKRENNCSTLLGSGLSLLWYSWNNLCLGWLTSCSRVNSISRRSTCSVTRKI